MSRSDGATRATPADLRRLQARLPELPVPALLNLRDATAAALERENLTDRDIASVLAAAEPPR